MMQKNNESGFQSLLIAGFEHVVHGFSSRNSGDMRKSVENRKRFVKSVGLSKMPIFAHQTHGSLVPGDGLVSRSNPVAVITADCVPVLLVDPITKVCGAVHAGWKGTLGRIAQNAVSAMIKEGACAESIYAAVGAHIGACCYDIPEIRAKAFIRAFGSDERIVFENKGRWFLDLGWANYRQLVYAGVSADHIDAPPMCTSCQNHEFFSYRRDAPEFYGEMMAVIGFRV